MVPRLFRCSSVGSCFAGELADVGFSFFVDVEGAEVAAAGGLVECNVGCCTVFPVFGKGAEMLDPLFATGFISSLHVMSV